MSTPNSPFTPFFSLETLEPRVLLSNTAPVAAGDAYSVNVGSTLSVAAVQGVLSNDTDADNDTLSAIKVTDPSHGSVSLGSDGSFTYVPSAWHGTDSFTYKANNGQADSNTATVTITVGHVAPTLGISGDSSVNEGSAYTLNLSATEADQDTIDHWTITWGDGTSPQTVTGNPSSVPHTYADGPNTWVISATASDQDGTYAAASTKQIYVADVAPTIALSGSNVTDQSLYYHLTLGSITDLGQDTVSQWRVNWGDTPTPTYSTYSSAGMKSHRYLHADYGTGTTIVVSLVDEDGTHSNCGSKTIHVNSLPVSADDSYSTDNNTVLTAAGPGVLSNDTYADPNALTAELETTPGHGTVTLNEDGSFTYTPSLNYYGTDSFTYYAYDGMWYTDDATVTITVNHVNLLVANNDSYATNENTPNKNTQLIVDGLGILANDQNNDSDHTPSVTIGDEPGHGTLTMDSSTGAFTYVPDTNWIGIDSFTYTVACGSLTSSPATVTIAVRPTASPDTTSTDENSPITLASSALLNNDSDTSGLHVELVTRPAHGSIVSAGGNFTYTPAANWYGVDTFSYQNATADESLKSNVATVTITVNRVTLGQISGSGSYQTSENRAINGALMPLPESLNYYQMRFIDPTYDPTSAPPIDGTQVTIGHLPYTDGQDVTLPQYNYVSFDALENHYTFASGSYDEAKLESVYLTDDEFNTLFNAEIAAKDCISLGDIQLADIKKLESRLYGRDNVLKLGVALNAQGHGILTSNAGLYEQEAGCTLADYQDGNTIVYPTRCYTDCVDRFNFNLSSPIVRQYLTDYSLRKAGESQAGFLFVDNSGIVSGNLLNINGTLNYVGPGSDLDQMGQYSDWQDEIYRNIKAKLPDTKIVLNAMRDHDYYQNIFLGKLITSYAADYDGVVLEDRFWFDHSDNSSYTYCTNIDFYNDPQQNGSNTLVGSAGYQTWVNTDSTHRTMSINITSGSGSSSNNNTVTIPQDIPYAFKDSDFCFTDSAGRPRNDLQGIIITALPSEGSLTENGTAVTLGQTVPEWCIAAGYLVFTPASGVPTGPYTSFDFHVQENCDWAAQAKAAGKTLFYCAGGDYFTDTHPLTSTDPTVQYVWQWLHLVGDNQDFIYMNTSYDAAMVKYSVYSSPYGNATSDLTWDAGNHEWVRQYENGTITFDPSSGQLGAISFTGTLTKSLVTNEGPQHGTVTFGTDNTFTYTPTADWYGQDSFTYQTSDGVDTLTETMTITVAQA